MDAVMKERERGAICSGVDGAGGSGVTALGMVQGILM
jgi:hypothetical protein